jgi:hypothetical protein
MNENKTKVGKFLQSIGRPLSAIIGIAGEVSGSQTLESIANAIKGDKSLTQEEKDIALALAKMDFEDTANARDMQKTALSQDDLFSKRYIYYFSSFWSFVGATLLLGIMFVEIPENNIRLVDTAFGFMLGTVLASMFNYYFGSSSGSSKKDSILEKIRESKK